MKNLIKRMIREVNFETYTNMGGLPTKHVGNVFHSVDDFREWASKNVTWTGVSLESWEVAYETPQSIQIVDESSHSDMIFSLTYEYNDPEQIRFEVAEIHRVVVSSGKTPIASLDLSD